WCHRGALSCWVARIFRHQRLVRKQKPSGLQRPCLAYASPGGAANRCPLEELRCLWSVSWRTNHSVKSTKRLTELEGIEGGRLKKSSPPILSGEILWQADLLA